MDTSNKELIEQAERIKKGYATVMADEEEEQLTFLDEVNKLVRIIFKDTPADIYTILAKGELEKWKKQKYKRLFKKYLSNVSIRGILYFILGIITQKKISVHRVTEIQRIKTAFRSIMVIR